MVSLYLLSLQAPYTRSRRGGILQWSPAKGIRKEYDVVERVRYASRRLQCVLAEEYAEIVQSKFIGKSWKSL